MLIHFLLCSADYNCVIKKAVMDSSSVVVVVVAIVRGDGATALIIFIAAVKMFVVMKLLVTRLLIATYISYPPTALIYLQNVCRCVHHASSLLMLFMAC